MPIVRAFVHGDASDGLSPWVLTSGAYVLTLDMSGSTGDQTVYLPQENVLLGDFAGVRVINPNPPNRVSVESPPGTLVDLFQGTNEGTSAYVFDGSAWLPIRRQG